MKNSLDYNRIKELIEDAVIASLEAAQYLKSHSGIGTLINKAEGKDIKLQSDLNSEQIIFEKLKLTGINILSEEAGYIEVNKEETELLWIVDPLDGSLNYSRDIPIYCISIGLWKNEQPLAGIIYNINTNEVYKGIIGLGATVNTLPISVSQIIEKSNSIICTGFPVYTSFDSDHLIAFVNKLQAFKKVRLLGSAAISLTLVAKGSIEAYCENNIALWDVAAGISLVLAAGGKCNFHFTDKSKHLLFVNCTN